MTHNLFIKSAQQSMIRSLLFGLVLIFLSGGVNANTYYVTTASDTGSGSLRSMIDSANVHSGLDTVSLSLGAHDTIHIAGPLPIITDSLVITGRPCQNPTVNGDSLGFIIPAFLVANAAIPLTINYLNIFNCKFTNGTGAAGAISAGYLYLNHCYFYGNYLKQANTPGTGSAGAVTATNLWAYNSTFNGNSWFGATTVLTNGAGAVSSHNGHLFNCTFVNNHTQSYGGALNGGFTEIQNCTFANNTAKVDGGGIYSSYTGYPNFLIANCIVFGNTVTSPIGNNYKAGISMAQTTTSGGCNILQDTAVIDSFKISGTDLTGGDPQFGTFGYYSGCVPVLPILCGSVAQDHATCSGATTADAEGIAAQGIRDAGAFEITRSVLGGDTLDSISRGTTANLYNYFNTTGLTITWPAGLNDSSAGAVDTGTYTVIGTNFLGCSDTATATILYSTDTLNIGIKGISANNGFSLFPNPVKETAFLSWTGSMSGMLDLELTDVLGRGVIFEKINASAGRYAVHTGQLVSGMYYISVRQGNESVFSNKLVVVGR